MAITGCGEQEKGIGRPIVDDAAYRVSQLQEERRAVNEPAEVEETAVVEAE